MKRFNKLVALVGALVMTAMLATGMVQAAETADTYPNLSKISTSEIFQQEPEEYYVYFYKERCPYCNDVKTAINEFAATGGKIYGVDYAIFSNRVNGYDWTQVSNKYNKKIGHINKDGSKQFLLGESEEKYLNSTEKNMYGKIIRYQITEIDEYNINNFPGSVIGDLYAEVQTPEIDYAAVINPSDLTIAGVPTLLHIRNGKIDNFYFDSTEIGAFLAGIK